MKAFRRSSAIVLALVLLIGLLVPAVPKVNAAISTSTFNTKVQEFISDSRWQNGTAWTSSQTPKLSTWSSTGCCAYAADFAAYVYGSTSAAWTSSDFTKFTDLNEIRAGDIIYITGHWFVVLERNGDSFRTAEGSFDSKARVCSDGWGIQNGKIHNLKATSSERTFEYGYHYNFADSTTYSSSQIYYNIDLSSAVLSSRINQQVSGDCAVVSMATVEAYLYGATSTSEKDTVYDALVSANGDNDYANWGSCGYVSHSSINWATVYERLGTGFPVIVHRPATSSKSEHWAVVAGYKGSTTTLEADKFIIVDVYHGSGSTDIYTSGDWRGSTTIDRMVTRKNGIAITSLSGIRMAINHPQSVHPYGNGHGVYGYVTSNAALTSVQVAVTNTATGTAVYNKTIAPNAKSYSIFSLDSEMTFAKWAEGKYSYTVTAKTSSTTRTYQYSFEIASGWPVDGSVQSYTFTYDATGGTGAPGSQVVYFGGTLHIPATIPTRTGYTFLGWYAQRNGDQTWYSAGNGWHTEEQLTANGYTKRLYPTDTDFIINNSWVSGCPSTTGFTFFAVWEADPTVTYTVSYDANGGTGAPASQTKTHDVSLTLSSTAPTRSGYTFLGWATSASATSAAYQPGGSFTANADTTLYAVWSADQYTITYNANGGTGAPASQTKTHDASLTLSSTAPTRSGYTFLGWATSSTASSAAYQPGDSFTTNADTTLYAVWQQETVSTGAQIIVESVDARAGETITIPVRIVSNPGVAYVKLKLSYSEGLELVSAEDQGVLTGTYTTSQTIDTKPYVIQWMGADNAIEDGTIVLLTFKVAEDAEDGAYSVSVTCEEAYDAEYEDIIFEITNATVTVTSFLTGDVNDDGKVNGKDGIMLAQYLAEWDVAVNVDAADVNGDGKVNGKDGILLAQYLAEWDVTLG